jgi:MFS family permease
MLGLFMILPVFALYAERLEGVTTTLVGVAIGIYGLTQGVLQIPFGMLSDHFGRKRIITIGLLLFAVGSVIAALSTSILGVIIGRALQGGGAIASASLALTADLTREEHRVKAMAIIGMSIGMSFMLAMVLGPIFNHWIGVPGIFWLTAVFAIVAIAILHLIVPQPIKSSFHRDTEPVPAQFKRVLKNTQLLRLYAGVFLLHWLMTSLFIELPIALRMQLDVSLHWQVYLPVLLIAVVVMIPFIIIAEKYRHLKLVFVGAVGLLSLSQMGFIYLHQGLFGIAFMLAAFFSAFNLLESLLPSLVSRISPAESKGTAMGIYSSSQFFGAFLGGMCGGWLHHHYSMEVVFAFSAGLAVVWFFLAVTMQKPCYLTNYMLNVGPLNPTQANELSQQLLQMPGVAEAVVVIEDEIAYLKIDRRQVDQTALEKFSL